MLLIAVHFGYVLVCIVCLFIGALKKMMECLAQGFLWGSTEPACLSSFKQRPAASLQHRLSHCTYCKWRWCTEILKLLLETELSYMVWLVHGSLRDWAKGAETEIALKLILYTFSSQECCATGMVMVCVCKLASTSENFAWHTGNQEEYSSVYRYLPALKQCWGFINICRVSLIETQTKYY